jgi:hypothetical protein
MTSSGTAPDDAGEPPATPDYLSRTGAEALAQAIRDYWGRGVTVWVEPDAGAWCIRSNLERGLPPPATAA